MNQILLQSEDELISDLLEAGVVTWDDLVRSVRSFHYGRNSNRANLSLVWYERKGSCSSKHAFLKHVADLCKIPNIELMLTFYKMNEINTPGIGSILKDNGLDHIPEAHCYIKDNGRELDVTTVQADFSRYSNVILETNVIQANDVIENKISWHKAYIKNWMIETNQTNSFKEIWSIREACIHQLSINK